MGFDAKKNTTLIKIAVSPRISYSNKIFVIHLYFLYFQYGNIFNLTNR